MKTKKKTALVVFGAVLALGALVFVVNLLSRMEFNTYLAEKTRARYVTACVAITLSGFDSKVFGKTAHDRASSR